MSGYTIETDDKAGIDRIINQQGKSAVMVNRMGGELIGYDVFDPVLNKNLPLLWNNNNPEAPANGWKNHATILFPIVGGMVNKQSRLGDVLITSKGNHGFARHSLFALVGQEAGDDAAQLQYQLLPNDEIRGYYPFGFKLVLTYVLQGNNLSLAFKIANPDPRPIYFCFGWHPGFSGDLGLGGKKEEWQIIFPDGDYRHYLNNPECQLTGEVLDKRFKGPLEWDEKTLEATIMLEIGNRANRTCTLYNPKLERGVKVDFADFPHFGLWANEGENYFCLEPWQGMDDHEKQEPFDQKVGVVKLEPGESIEKTAGITPILHR